jgi:hypothetical protein
MDDFARYTRIARRKSFSMIGQFGLSGEVSVAWLYREVGRWRLDPTHVSPKKPHRCPELPFGCWVPSFPVLKSSPTHVKPVSGVFLTGLACGAWRRGRTMKAGIHFNPGVLRTGASFVSGEKRCNQRTKNRSTHRARYQKVLRADLGSALSKHQYENSGCGFRGRDKF